MKEPAHDAGEVVELHAEAKVKIKLQASPSDAIFVRPSQLAHREVGRRIDSAAPHAIAIDPATLFDLVHCPRSDAHHDRLPPAGSPRAGGRTEPPTAAAAALAPAAAPTSRGAPSTDAADPVPEPELPREAPAAAAASATTTTTAAPASASATATATAASATSTAASATAAPSAAGAPAAPQKPRAAAVAFAAGLWHCPEQAARDVQAQVGAAAALAEYVLARAKC